MNPNEEINSDDYMNFKELIFSRTKNKPIVI